MEMANINIYNAFLYGKKCVIGFRFGMARTKKGSPATLADMRTITILYVMIGIVMADYLLQRLHAMRA